MDRDDIDRWLSDDDAIVPSSGFASGVMDAVRREASEPQAIPFPWKRALPGMVATAVALFSVVGGGFLAFNAPAQTAADGPLGPLLANLLRVGTSAEVGWVVFAAIMTVVPAMVSMRLTRGH